MRFIILLFVFISSVAHANDKEPEIKIKQLADNVYQYISYERVEPYGMVAANGLIVVDGKEAYLIDTPWTQKESEQLLTWVKSKGLTVKASVSTHFHQDASGGIPLLNHSGIKTYATALTNNLLRSENQQASTDEIPSNPFELVTNTIEVFYPGAGHTQDNSVVWLPQAKILFGGCLVRSLNSSSLGYTGDASVKDWPKSIQRVINKYPDAKAVVPGHGEVGDMSLLSHTQQLAAGSKQ